MSLDHRFIDYDYIKDYKGTTDPEECGEWLDEAIRLVKDSELYRQSTSLLRERGLPEKDESFSFDFADYLDENGEILPVFNEAFIEDFNRDGLKECFMLVDIPYLPAAWGLRSFVIYCDSSGCEILTEYSEVYEISLLDYGVCKQIVFCSRGSMGADSRSDIFGVVDGQPVSHYCFRGGFVKRDCFLAAFGRQGSGDFMYYDTAAREYRAILGREMTIDEAFKMDTAGSLDAGMRDYTNVVQLCNKYYLFVAGTMHTGDAYTYEGGAFTYCGEDSGFRISYGRDTNSIKYVDYDTAVASMRRPERFEYSCSENSGVVLGLSMGHRFIDYDYITDYNYESRSVPDEVLSAALEAMKKHSSYLTAAEDAKDIHDERLAEFRDENGDLIPVFNSAFCDDYDSDGTEEYFIILDTPTFKLTGSEAWDRVNNLVFVSSYGSAEVVAGYIGTTEVSLLDYGVCRQLLICANGSYGTVSHSDIIGVIDGSAKQLYTTRGTFAKWECFLTVYSTFGNGATLYYNTAAQEYCTVCGVYADPDEVFLLDKTNVLPRGMRPIITVFGGKYYLVQTGDMDDGEVFIYENGEFVPASEDFLLHKNADMYGLYTVYLDDIDGAIASMLTPEEALAHYIAEHSPSEGHRFIDYHYIEDCKGTTDPEDCGEWPEKAINAVKASNDYKRFNALLKEEELSETELHYGKENFNDFLDENGDIQPVFSRAFIEDFDNNGTNECFMLINIPYNTEYSSGRWIVRSYLVYSDEDDTELLTHYCADTFDEISMLDYGLCRQLIFVSWGTMGADAHSEIFGVVDGEAVMHYAFRGYFYKADCFMNASGWQGIGDFMYYDTVRQEYRSLASKHIPTKTILEMDSTGVFAEYYDDYAEDENALPWFMLVGNKFYCLWLGPSDMGTPYLYENGEFIPCGEEYKVRICHGIIELDYDEAVASMLTPKQAKSLG